MTPSVAERVVAATGEFLYGGAVVAVFFAFAGACFFGIANDWQWGHNGYNGAAFWQAATNSLRFGIVGQALYYTGAAPPPTEAIYTHHPMMLHGHLVAMQALFGTAPAVGRLVPALYSLAGLGVLFVLVRACFDRATALCAITLYALTPLHLIFANMINHEQGSIFWMLLLLDQYRRHLESVPHQRPWRSHLALVLVAVSVACQFDWPAYYFAFFIALHALAVGLRRGPRPGWQGVEGKRPPPRWLQWRPEYTFVLLFSIVVLVNFVGFFLWIKNLRSGLGEMGSAFAGRSSSPDSYYARLWQRSLDLYGPWLIALTVAWVPLVITRIVRRRAHFGDFVALLFLVGQAIHSLVFKQAGFIHCYWTFYIGPTVAIGGATMLVATGHRLADGLGWLVARLQRQTVTPGLRAGLKLTVALALALGLATVQVPLAWARLQWGFATGSASYVVPYDPQLAEAAFAKALNARYSRNRVNYLLHPSLEGRIELWARLDAPLEDWDTFEPPKTVDDRKFTVFLADLAHVEDRAGLRALAERHPTRAYDRRFVAIEVGTPSTVGAELARPRLESWHAQPQPRPGWWRWLVHPTRPPQRWVLDAKDPSPFELLTPDVRVLATPTTGGTGGTPLAWPCARGEVLVGLVGRQQTKGDQPLVAALGAECRTVSLEKRRVVTSGATRQGPIYGDQGIDGNFRVRCEGRDLPVGVYGRTGSMLDSVGLVCARDPIVTADGAGNWTLRTSGRYRTQRHGGAGGSGYELTCPEGSVAWGLVGRHAAVIDQVGVQCAAFEPALLVASRAEVEEPRDQDTGETVPASRRTAPMFDLLRGLPRHEIRSVQ